ncbi:MAG: hypothetical protein KDJ25_17170 [Rhodoblastus sp.]|nr:hypothetical protein [Rhodoblastus sp.]
MQTKASKPGSPGLFFVFLAMATLAFALLLADAFRYRAGGGDAVLSAAFTIIYDVLMVWTALVVLTAVAAIQGDMPAGGWIAAIVLLPASGVATAAAIDLATRGGRWALVVPCLLPPLIGSYATWARLPRLRAAVPAKAATYGVWGVVLVLSAVAGYGAM